MGSKAQFWVQVSKEQGLMWGFRGSPLIKGCSLGKLVGVREARYTGKE